MKPPFKTPSPNSKPCFASSSPPNPATRSSSSTCILHAAWNQHRCECAQFELRAESPNPNRDPLLTEVKKVEAAIDKSDKGRGRGDIVLAATAEQTLRSHFAKQESEADGFSLGRLFRR
ncbi:MAG: hypothetical protein JNK87_35750 [Bryobacterales bacterium]|nr:hypothetical protein [Bryobacterales bacterium]